jgi:parallel beta-helix repeat protein
VGAADAGDSIFVWNGSYTENVDVGTTHLTLEGEGADVVTMTAASIYDHVFEVTADYVNISGFNVTGATGEGTGEEETGICLYYVDHCDISDNSALNSRCGIYLRSSNYNMLQNNTCLNDYCGVYVWYLSNNYGIYLYNSDSNTLQSNTANSNHGNGIYLYSSNDNTLTNNTANSNGGNGIRLRNTINNNMLGNTTANSNHGSGIELWFSCGSTLTNNTANSNDCSGIYLGYSSNNTLTSNAASNNGGRLHGASGIQMRASGDNTLTNNIANSNDYSGIRMWDSSIYNTLTNNTANSNGDDGIYLSDSSNNIITCNWVQNNTDAGFYLRSGSTGNNISYNNVIENGNYNTETGGWEWQFYNDQLNLVEAKHNYLGAGMNNSTIDASIYDDEEGGGRVEFYMFETEPVQCPLTPEPPEFTTADAVIALQIAVGSRLPDLRWDVSGDGSVTSLDALMILQAADGA